MERQTKSVGIVGCGLIGQSWAMLFIAYGYRVRMYDLLKDQVDKALSLIEEKLKQLELAGQLRGRGTSEEQLLMLSGTTDLNECINGAIHVQECVFELLEIKLKVFSQLAELSDDCTILASSSSAIPCSKFTENLHNVRQRCLVAHPVNPPYYMSLVEIVPSPWTSPDVVAQTRALMIDIGQSPVVLNKEIPAFIQPRIQYAIMAECFRLVQDEVLDIDDVDKVIREGLGLGYTFLGPFESLHLSNDSGFAGLLRDEGNALQTICDSLGAAVPLDPKSALMHKIADLLFQTDPAGEGLVMRRRWRDERLGRLAQLKRSLEKEGEEKEEEGRVL